MSAAKPYVSGTGYAPPVKKSTVAQTCNQLSLFLKEKQGCLKDLHRFGINSKFDDHSVKSTKTMDLLSEMENVGQNTYDKPLDSECKSKEMMTIFYKGQVIVLDDISEDRAKEVMQATAATATLLASQQHMGSNRRMIDVQLQPKLGFDLPIARRASLHKFLAKRKKDKLSLRPHPYPLHHPSSTSSHKNNHYNHKFDLNF